MFDLIYPPRLSLAHTPTPFHPLHRLSERLGRPVWAKRDDCTGAALSGNKVRKLEFLLADAQSRGATCVATCGGVNSNHARATAVAARRLGLAPHLILRGAPPAAPNGNLFLDRWVGAELQFITHAQWPQVDDLLEAWAKGMRSDGHIPYVIPEGGSNGLGLLGYARAAQEILDDEQASGGRVGAVVHAVGSGGTTAGLAAGFCAAGRSDIRVVGVAACDDQAYFDARIRRILQDAVRSGWVPEAVAQACRWEIVEGFVGPGYARTTPQSMASHREVATLEGLIVDPVYTGKAMQALQSAPERVAAQGTDLTVFLHTGGIFELFAFGAEAHAHQDLPSAPA